MFYFQYGLSSRRAPAAKELAGESGDDAQAIALVVVERRQLGTRVVAGIREALFAPAKEVLQIERSAGAGGFRTTGLNATASVMSQFAEVRPA